MKRALEPLAAHRKAPKAGAGRGDWLSGFAPGATGLRRYRLFRPAGIRFGERVPLLVMLHGCHQDAKRFADSTRMNALAARERFMVLYPEQDRRANAQGCWNWFDTASGRAQREMASILAAIDQVCLFYMADRSRVAMAGLSAGASMAAMLAREHPARFAAVAMHSGVPPGLAHSSLTAVAAMRGHVQQAGELRADLPPLLVLHGVEDGLVALKNAHAAVQLWAADARPGPQRCVQRGTRYAMTVQDFKRGRAVAATLVQIDQLTHAWSGGASDERFSDPQGPDASRLIWQFVQRRFGVEMPTRILAAA